MKTDHKMLFVGTYTNPDFDVDEPGQGIYTLSFDPESGALEVQTVTKKVENPSYLAVDPDRRRLYAVNERMARGRFLPGKVSAFKIRRNGQLRFLNSVLSEGACPCHLSFDLSHRNLFAANYVSGTVAHLELEPDGRLREAVSVDQHSGAGPTERQLGPHAHYAACPPDGRFVYSVDLGADTVFCGSWNGNRDGLEPAKGAYKTASGAGPRHLVFHPTMPRAYVVMELNATVEVVSVDRETGALGHLQTVSTLPAGETGFGGCSAVRISPDGQFLYAGNRGEYHSVAVYRINAVSGLLTFVGVCPTGGQGPRDFVLDPSGAFLVVANQGSGTVVSFRLDPVTGLLDEKLGLARVPTPVCLTFL